MDTMKMYVTKILIGVMLMAESSAPAGETAYIDLNKVANNYYLAIEKIDAFQARRTMIIKETSLRARETKKANNQFIALHQAAGEITDTTKRQTFIDAARESRLSELKLDAELKDFHARHDALIKKEFDELSNEILKDIKTRLADFAREKKLEAVANVSGRAMPYYDKSKDITYAFLAKINTGHEDYVKKMIEKRNEEAGKTAAGK